MCQRITLFLVCETEKKRTHYVINHTAYGYLLFMRIKYDDGSLAADI